MLIAILGLAVVLRFWGLGRPAEEYFDEVHYVPAAAVLAGLRPHPGLPEWSGTPLFQRSPDPNFFHPPLGKAFIGAGMRLLGDNPWGWRFMPACFGLLSLWVFCRLARLLFGEERAALAATFLMSIDTLHLAQSRIAMLDVFLLFFNLLAMLVYLELESGEHARAEWLTLCLTASVALAAALWVKHVSVLTLGVWWLLLLTGGRQPLRQRLATGAVVTLGTVLLYPLGYLAWYAGHGYTVSEWLQLQQGAAQLTASTLQKHPYGSHPLDWLLDRKAVWYYYQAAERVTGIVGIGNPVLWLLFLPAWAVLLAFGIYRLRRRAPGPERVILVWFLGWYLPMLFILRERQGWIYYMLPMLPPMVLAIVQALTVVSRDRKPLFAACGLAALATAVLLPFVLGLPVPQAYYELIIRIAPA